VFEAEYLDLKRRK